MAFVVVLSSVVLVSCGTQRSMVMQGGKYRKAKRWEVRQIQAQKGFRSQGRSCSEEW
jgi:major membrane immunogen (membrane-anchored lipoprotein)